VLFVWFVFKTAEKVNTPEWQAAAESRKAEREAAAEDDRVAAEKAKRERDEAAAKAARDRAEAAEKVRRESPTFSVDDVVSYYAANEVAGDEELKNRVFKVEGSVDRVGKDLLGTSYVLFKSKPGSIRSVQCMFGNDGKGQLAKLRPGQHIVVFGECKGLMMNVIMEECEIVTRH